MNFLFKGDNKNIDTDPESNTNNQESKGFLEKFTPEFLASPKERISESPLDKILSYFEVDVSYTSFFLVFGFGIAILFLSFMFLPLVLIRPQKFVMLFSLGSTLVLMSFIFIHGTKEFLKMLFSSGRIIFSGLYFVSLIFGIYFSFTDSWMFISHICALFQLSSLVVFVLTFLPGGYSGISFLWNMIKSKVIG
mmetsp:Transcript_22835/g.23780  ORF Transcript_22835/g.23780 Transcript_22835/m.23780 type:complete len:193 (+) Transcript_22835:1-579(+)